MRVGNDNGGRLGNDDDRGYPRWRQPEQRTTQKWGSQLASAKTLL